ncbi:MAG: M20 family metallopeptidase [Cyanophyceae cyanobacterium]
MVSTAPDVSTAIAHKTSGETLGDTSDSTSPAPLNQRVRPAVRSLHPELLEWRRHLHQYPELGFRENLTAQFISHKLGQWGIDHQTGVAETGIVAVIEGTGTGAVAGAGEDPKKAPVLGIRADMDALPVREQNEVWYRSRHEGKLHACGHDGHVAIALGTAKYLSEHRDTFAGTVKIIFQPAEEGPGGAEPMIQAGALKTPDVDAIIGRHIWNNLAAGTVVVRSGPLMAAVETFHLKILGKGGHGAMPDQTVDSIVVASQIVNALQTIVARNVDPIDSAVVTVGTFQAGSALNVIAISADLCGTVRYFNPKLVGAIEHRIRQIVAHTCQMHGATFALDYKRLYPATVNDPAIATLIKSIAEDVLETPLGVIPDCQTMGGEDMSYFLQAVPGCYFFLGSANAAQNLDYPHHHPRFNFDESVLVQGVEIFARCVETFCGEPQ